MIDPTMYPGTALRKGDTRPHLVRMIQERLNAKGIQIKVDGAFGPKTVGAVKVLQTRSGVEADGTVGPITWGLLFGALPQTTLAPTSALTGAALRILQQQEGVRELGGANKGPDVEKFLASVGLGPGYPWCMAVQYWCFQRAAETLGIENPLPRTASVRKHWEAAPDRVKISATAPLEDLRNLAPGTLFFIRHGEEDRDGDGEADWFGHTGMVLGATPFGLSTREGNTNVAGSREGDGVYKRMRRYGEVNVGYVDWGLF